MLELPATLLSKVGRQHLLNFSSYFFSKALSLALFAFAVSYFLRSKGEIAYGVISLVLLLYTYLQVIDLGIGYAVVYRLARAVSRGGRENWKIVAGALPIYLACSMVIALVLVLVAKPLATFLLGDALHYRLFQLAGIGAGLLILSALCVAVMQAYNRVYFINLSRLLFDIVKAVALIFGVEAEQDLNYVLWITVLGAFAKLAVDVSLASRLLGTKAWLRPRISPRSLYLNLSVGAPLFVSSLSFAIINSVDKIVVTKLFSPAVLAVYSTVTDLHAKAYFLIWAVTGSLYTVLIHRQTRGQSVRNLIRLAALAVFGVLVLYYIPLAVFAREILSIWINDDFAAKGYGLLRWLLVPTCLYMVANIMEVYLQTAGAGRRLGHVYVLALLVQLGALSILPQRFGVTGIVWAVSLMHLSLVVCMTALVVLSLRKKARS